MPANDTYPEESTTRVTTIPSVGAPRPAAALPQPDLLALAGVGFAALHVFGDQHVTVEDPHQMLRGDRLHRLPGQHNRHPVTEPA